MQQAHVDPSIRPVVAAAAQVAEETGNPAGAIELPSGEVVTGKTIWKFADTPVDVAIVEVGMGGLWDATNVLNADAAIIGPVDMDHMQWLGDTVEQIATEKAGIIKPNCTAIIGPQPHEEAVMPILTEAAERNHAMLVRDGYEMTCRTVFVPSAAKSSSWTAMTSRLRPSWALTAIRNRIST